MLNSSLVKSLSEEFCASKHLCVLGSLCSIIVEKLDSRCVLCGISVHNQCASLFEVKHINKKKANKDVLKICYNCISVNKIKTILEIVKTKLPKSTSVTSGLEDSSLLKYKRFILVNLKKKLLAIKNQETSEALSAEKTSEDSVSLNSPPLHFSVLQMLTMEKPKVNILQ